MPLPKSVLCSKCRKNYPEGWQRCPYCGHDELRSRLEAQSRKFMVRKVQEFEQRTGVKRDDRRSDSTRPARGGRPQPQAGPRPERAGRGRDRANQPRGPRPARPEQGQRRRETAAQPRQDAATASAGIDSQEQKQPLAGERTGRSRRRRKRGGGGASAPPLNGAQPGAQASAIEKPHRAPLTPGQRQSTRPPRPRRERPAAGTPAAAGPASAPAANPSNGAPRAEGEGRKRKRFRRRRGGSGQPDGGPTGGAPSGGGAPS